MIITCGQCQARFKVAPEQIKVTGSKVRCSHCLYVFTVYRPGGPEAGTEAERNDGFPGAASENEDLFQDEETESARDRRERRRRLYAGPDEKEDDSTDDEGWTEAGLDEASGRPPLRRRPAAAGTAPAETLADAEPPAEPPLPEPAQPEPAQPEPPRAEPEAWDSEPPAEPLAETGEAPAEPADALGLEADPTRSAPLRLVGDELPPPPAAGQEGGEVRAAVTRVKGRRNGLFLGLAIFCAALAIGLYYLSSRPEPLAFSEGDGPARAPPRPNPPAPTPGA
jgi:predicted Zn finger-like uncharacterized protein